MGWNCSKACSPSPTCTEILLTITKSGLGLDGDCICPDNFPLPMLEHLLADLSTDIHTGKGFCVLRGLDPSRYTAEDNILLFLGISSYIGARRGRQSCWGEMISKAYSSEYSKNHL
jgi:hypothetical protein